LEVHAYKPRQLGFDQHIVIGAAAKEIVRSLLESSGYNVYPFGYESSLSALKTHIRERGLQDTDLVQRVRSMPDFIVSAEKDLKLVEVKFRNRRDKDGRPGFFLKNIELNRYKQFWGESFLVLLSPHGGRFFSQSVRSLIPGSQETKWFDYRDFDSLPKIFPATGGRLENFSTAVNKLAGLWENEKEEALSYRHIIWRSYYGSRKLETGRPDVSIHSSVRFLILSVMLGMGQSRATQPCLLSGENLEPWRNRHGLLEDHY